MYTPPEPTRPLSSTRSALSLLDPNTVEWFTVHDRSPDALGPRITTRRASAMSDEVWAKRVRNAIREEPVFPLIAFKLTNGKIITTNYGAAFNREDHG